MAVERSPEEGQPPPERPQLRLVDGSTDSQTLEQDEQSRFSRGLMWGLVISLLGFWMPVTAALWRWLAH